MAHREEVLLIVSLKTVFENLNLVNSYDYTILNHLVLSLWVKYIWGLTYFGPYMSWVATVKKICMRYAFYLIIS